MDSENMVSIYICFKQVLWFVFDSLNKTFKKGSSLQYYYIVRVE